ncbi:MAG: DUF4340 domain-containing protein [Spirochaetota bacterium]
MRRFTLDLPRRTALYAAIAVLLAVVFVVQEAATTRRGTVALPRVPQQIDRIELADGDDRVVLRRSAPDEGAAAWTVGQADYPADSTAITPILDSLRALDEVDVVTARGDYDAYGLADGARTIAFFLDDEEVLSLEVGDGASAGDATYARVDGGSEVVLLPGTIATRFSTNPDDFRPDEIVAVPESEVEQLTIRSQSAAPVVVRRSAATGDSAAEGVDGQDAAWQIDAEQEIPASRVDLLLDTLAPLRADGFADEPPAGEPFATLEVARAAGEVVEVSLWPPVEDGTYPARASSYDYPFLVRPWRARRLLLQVDDYFAPFEDEE